MITKVTDRESAERWAAKVTSSGESRDEIEVKIADKAYMLRAFYGRTARPEKVQGYLNAAEYLEGLVQAMRGGQLMQPLRVFKLRCSSWEVTARTLPGLFAAIADKPDFAEFELELLLKLSAMWGEDVQFGIYRKGTYIFTGTWATVY